MAPIGISLLLPLAVLLGAAAARAAEAARPTIVAVEGPASPSPAVGEILVRLRGELTSLGFQAHVITDDAVYGERPTEDPRVRCASLAARPGIDAVIAVPADLAPAAVVVCVVDKVTGRSLLKELTFESEPGRATNTLALRAIELLRSALLEVDLAARERERAHRDERAPSPAEVTTRPPEPQQPPPPSLPERWGVEVGGAAVMSWGGVGPSISPVVRLTWASSLGWAAQLAVAALGTRPTVERLTGSAQVAEAYGTLGVCYRFRPGWRLRPLLALSAGALHTSVEGRAEPPDQGHNTGQWSFLLEGAAGTHLRVSERFFLAIAAHLQVAEPYPTLRFVGTREATAAHPNLLFTLAMGAWL